MENKCKLKGERIFIEHDLIWKDRIIQSKLSMWARAKKEKGKNVTIGVGRVRVNGIWKAWKDIKRDFDREKVEREQDKVEKNKGQGIGMNNSKVERWIRSKKEDNEIVETVGKVRINGVWKSWVGYRERG